MTDFPNILFVSTNYLWMTAPKRIFMTSQASLDRIDILKQEITLAINYEIINEILNSCGDYLEFEARSVTTGAPNEYESGRAIAIFHECVPGEFYIERLTTPYALVGEPPSGNEDILKATLLLRCEIEFIG